MVSTPILQVKIDDSAFQRYIAAFNKYQAQLKEQPEMWKGTSEGISESAIAAGALAAAIAEQAEETRKLSEEEKKCEDAKRAAAKARKKEEDDARKAEEAAAKRRKDAINQVREYARNAADLALNLGKYAIGGGLLGGALSMFGLDKLVGGVADQRRLSMGLGTSMGAQQGAALNMQRYFDVNSVMENVANAQGNPASWGTFRMMGINPQGKDPAELTYEAARAARRMFIADKGNLGLAQAQGLTNIFSPDDLRRMAAEKPKEFEDSIRHGQKFTGLNDEVGRKWQRFMIRVDEAGLTIKNALADKLLELDRSGALTNIVKAFSSVAVAGIDAFGKFLSSPSTQEGLKNFSTYLGGKQFQTDFKTFIDDISIVAGKLSGLVNLLGVTLPDKVYHDDPKPIIPGLAKGLWGAAGDISHVITGQAAAAGKWFSDMFSSGNNGSVADRNNNPGNIMRGGHVAKFGSMQQGAGEMARQLLIDYDKHHLHSVYDIINDRSHGWSNEWAPGNSHQAVMNYINSVSKALGVRPHDDVHLHDDTMLRKFLVAQNAFERGGARHMGAAKGGKSHVHVTLKNQTGASVATNVNAAAGG